MPELQFKGKEFVYNHHLTVPYRPLEMDASKSIGKPSLNGNLIIHGDNLHALKALLPMYAGKVDCIFIDPPYNTGNEGWNYNDNVNSPMMREWLNSNPVNAEDMLRHDKWCAMMYPRFKLLGELLSDQGTLWMTLDDNEVHHARAILDEVLGEANFVACIAWEKRYTRSNNAKKFYSLKDYVIAYRKSEVVKTLKEARNEKSDEGYNNPDSDQRGPWMTSSYINPATRSQRPNLCYPITNPFSGASVEHSTHAWKYERPEHERHVAENRLWWGKKGDAQYPRLKLFLSQMEQLVPVDVWKYQDTGTTDEAGEEIKQIFGEAVFDTPKPTRLVSRILSLIGKPEALVLDSFAGSGTTAHAVLKMNQKDGGNRRFILIEAEDYADSLTAERVRRVMGGYKFEGTQKEELLRESVTFASLKNPERLLKQVEAVENLDGHKYDVVKKEIEGDELIVIGEKKVSKKAEGVGGDFTFCSLGQPLDLDKILTGKELPEFEAIGAWLFHTATGEPLTTNKVRKNEWYLGESASFHVWLVYKPELDFLKSSKAALGPWNSPRKLPVTRCEIRTGKDISFLLRRNTFRTKRCCPYA